MIQIQKKGFSTVDAVIASYHFKKYRKPSHFHQLAEIAYVFDGEIEVTVGGKNEIARAGDIVVIQPFALHRYYSKEEKPVNLWLFLFSYSILSNVIHEGESVLRYDRAVFTPSEEVRALLLSRMIDTKEELVYPDEKTSRSIRSFLYPVFDEYLSSVSLIEEKGKIHAYSILKALDYMTNHFRENINLKSVASAIGYSESHISHSFSSVLSVSFRECLNMLRIEYAKKLILTTNMSTIHIGIESGFTCERSFHRAFFKSMNTTPAKYRQMHKNSIRKA